VQSRQIIFALAKGPAPGVDKEHIANIEQIEYIKNIDG
jgi:hypothetical protein